MGLRFTAFLSVLFLFSAIASAADTPSATIAAGTYVSARSYFAGNQLVVSDWADSQLVSGGINYGAYTSSFQIRIQHMAGEKENVFYGKGTLVSGQCSWPIEIKLYSYTKKLYVEDTGPSTIYTDCSSSDNAWTPTVEPFELR